MLTKKDYCDYETCVALVELGMRITSRKAYSDRDTLKHSSRGVTYTVRTASAMGWVIAIPLYEAQKWLREEKGMLVDSMVFADNSRDADGKVVDRWIYYACAIFNTSTAEFIRDYDHSDEYETYEEALSEGVRASIKWLKERK